MKKPTQEAVKKDERKSENGKDCDSKAGPHFDLPAKPFKLQHAGLCTKPAGEQRAKKHQQ